MLAHVSDGLEVQVVQLPLLYAFIMRWQEMQAAAKAAKIDWPIQDSPDDAYAAFRNVADKKGISRLNEWNPGFGALEKALKRAKQK